MYVQGVSTRKVKAITQELCGEDFSASTISRINQSLDRELKEFAHRELHEEYPYLILDARYEKVREGGVVRSQAVLTAIGVSWEGRLHLGGGTGQPGVGQQLEGVFAGSEETRINRGGVGRE